MAQRTALGGAVDGLVGHFARRSRTTLRDRVRRARTNGGLAVQSGLGAGLAYFVAHDLVGHPRPFFAPVAAVITLAVSVGQRLRRAVDLVIGVALGIGVGDVLIVLIGTGPWQIGLVVALAVLVAIFTGSGSALVTQAATSAVLMATLTPPGSGLSFSRFIDALIGGVVGLAVMALLLPLNPLTVVSRAAGPILRLLGEGLTGTAEALAGGDRDRAAEVLARLRAAESDLSRFQEALAAGQENATVAPARWRARGALTQYVEGAEYLAHALRNTRVLLRRSIAVIKDGEPVPDALPVAVRALGESVALLRRELADGVEPAAARGWALRSVQAAAEAYAAGVGFSGSVVVAQLRSIAIDLLHACGVPHGEAERTVRQVFKRATPTQASPPVTPER